MIQNIFKCYSFKYLSPPIFISLRLQYSQSLIEEEEEKNIHPHQIRSSCINAVETDINREKVRVSITHIFLASNTKVCKTIYAISLSSNFFSFSIQNKIMSADTNAWANFVGKDANQVADQLRAEGISLR